MEPASQKRTLHPLYALRKALYTLRSTLCALRFTLYALRFALRALRFALCALRFTLCTLRFAFRALRSALCALRFALCALTKQVYAMTPIAHDLPLVDLHRHLDGNVRLETVLELGRMHGVALPADTVEGLRPFGQVQGVAPSLMDFTAKFELLKLAFVDEDAIARIAEENIEDAHREGIAYLESRLSPAFMGERYGLSPERVLRACCRGVRVGTAKWPVRANLIGIMSRHLGEAICWSELEAAIACMGEGVVAVDLAGDEANFPGSRFVRHFVQTSTVPSYASCSRQSLIVSLPPVAWQLILNPVN